jgi:hypothetical protein
MGPESHGQGIAPRQRGLVGYEPPRVERVLAPEDLAHEILYAGTPPAPTAPVNP